MAGTRGNLYVLSAPSGTGKTTITRTLAAAGLVVVSVSHTTRAPRGQEASGAAYFFVGREEFCRRRDAGEFLEWAEVYGNLYGTSRAWVESQLAAGNNVLLEIDCQGAASVRAAVPSAILLFVAPPSMQELRRRLSTRGEDDAAAVKRRLKAAEREMARQNEFDYVIINDDVNRAVAQIAEIITGAAAT